MISEYNSFLLYPRDILSSKTLCFFLNVIKMEFKSKNYSVALYEERKMSQEGIDNAIRKKINKLYWSPTDVISNLHEHSHIS